MQAKYRLKQAFDQGIEKTTFYGPKFEKEKFYVFTNA